MTLLVTFVTAKATAVGLLVLRTRADAIRSGESSYATNATCCKGAKEGCADTVLPAITTDEQTIKLIGHACEFLHVVLPSDY